MPLRFEVVESLPFGENSYVVFENDGGDCFIVDPGFEPNKLMESLSRRRLNLVAIVNTHGHADHIAGNAAMKKRFPEAPLIIGVNDAHMLTDPIANLSGLAGAAIVSPPADQLVAEGETLQLLGQSWEVREIPGHSPGHVVFVCHEHQPIVVIGGDVLFAGSIGRSDFPGGDGRQLVQGIREKLYTLPDNAVVLPGHGPPTTIAEERESNPFTRDGFYVD